MNAGMELRYERSTKRTASTTARYRVNCELHNDEGSSSNEQGNKTKHMHALRDRNRRWLHAFAVGLGAVTLGALIAFAELRRQ